MSLARDECTDDRPPEPADDGTEVRHSTFAQALESAASTPPGARLRERREARGLTLDDVSRSTKINKTTLVALETSDVPHLPAGIYTRGFVKAYAREVGLDADSTADEYLAKIAPQRAQHPHTGGGALPAPPRRTADVVDDGEARHRLATEQARRFGGVAALAAAVGLLIYVASYSRGDQPPATLAEVSPESIADATPAGGAVPAPAPAVVDAAMTDGPFRIELVSQGPCWVSVSVDGERVLSKLLKAGERHTLDISDEVVLRIGEPGALSLSINGQAGRSLGRRGQPTRVRITKANFHEFLIS